MTVQLSSQRVYGMSWNLGIKATFEEIAGMFYPLSSFLYPHHLDGVSNTNWDGAWNLITTFKIERVGALWSQARAEIEFHQLRKVSGGWVQ